VPACQFDLPSYHLAAPPSVPLSLSMAIDPPANSTSPKARYKSSAVADTLRQLLVLFPYFSALFLPPLAPLLFSRMTLRHEPAPRGFRTRLVTSPLPLVLLSTSPPIFSGFSRQRPIAAINERRTPRRHPLPRVPLRCRFPALPFPSPPQFSLLLYLSGPLIFPAACFQMEPEFSQSSPGNPVICFGPSVHPTTFLSTFPLHHLGT